MGLCRVYASFRSNQSLILPVGYTPFRAAACSLRRVVSSVGGHFIGLGVNFLKPGGRLKDSLPP